MIVGDRLRQARLVAGLNQADLARAVGSRQPDISAAENGRRNLPPEVLANIADLTGFPFSFFEVDAGLADLGPSVATRAQARLPKYQREQSTTLGHLVLEQMLRMQDRVGSIKLSLPDIEPGTTPPVAARMVREALDLGVADPVPSLPLAFERLGVVVLALPLSAGKLDAFSAWTGLVPVVWLLDTPAGDRQAWSIAHEVGHLALRTTDCGPADEFARHFLLPDVSVFQGVSERTTLQEYALLKRHWRVSVQALVRSAYEYEVISKDRYQGLFRQISARGERLRERIAIPPAKPRGFRKLAEGLWGPSPVVGLARDANWSETLSQDVLQRHATLEELPRRVARRHPIASNVLPLRPRS